VRRDREAHGLLVYVIALIASGQGLFFYGLLFVGLSAMFIRGGITDDDFAGVGFGVGALFALMGLVPMFMAIRGWLSGEDDRARTRAAGIASYMLAPAPAAFAGPVTPAPVAARPPDDLTRLAQLGDLHARGVLTDDEFAAEKAKIIGSG
jgi:hypothetical protein